MNKKERMYSRIANHGINLMRIFGIQGIDPVVLAKKVHRIEMRAHKLAEDYCNGLIQSDDWYDIKEKKVLDGLDKILGFRSKNIPVFVNGDPRGYALKIDDAYVGDNNIAIHRDMGGYGILAPDFDGEA